MKPLRATTVILCACLAGAVTAHEGVLNKTVLERMDGMKNMGEATRVLVRMARGERPYDRSAARKARDALVAEARRSPVLFREAADDPRSEAKDAIWTNYADFTRKAETLAQVAASADLSSRETLRVAAREISRACVACHDAYRE